MVARAARACTGWPRRGAVGQETPTGDNYATIQTSGTADPSRLATAAAASVRAQRPNPRRNRSENGPQYEFDHGRLDRSRAVAILGHSDRQSERRASIAVHDVFGAAERSEP